MNPLRGPLSRRTLLRGLGGAAVALPFLEAMAPAIARAQSAAPKRFFVCYGGIAHGGGAMSIPSSSGALGTLPRAFTALDSVKQHVSLLTTMTVPTYNKGTSAPPGGRLNEQHGMIATPMLTGVYSRESMPVMPIAHSGALPGTNGAHTVDQLVADAIGGGNRLKSLQVRTQTIGYGGGPAKGVISGRMENGKSRGLDPISSLVTLYSTLFSGVSSGGGTSTPTLAMNLRRKKSVLDLVLGPANALANNVSSEDKARLDAYFTEIRELENRIQPTMAGGGASCSVPQKPTDPAIGNNAFGEWSSESTRGDIQADMIALAFACDITRSVSWCMTFDQCFMSSRYASGVDNDMHALSHQGTQQNLADNANWHAARLAKLVGKLASLSEGSDTVLDNTFGALLFAEGSNAHNSSNMCFVAAGSPSRLKMGQHIPTGGAHPAQLMVSGMQAVGMNVSKLGQINGPLASIMR